MLQKISKVPGAPMQCKSSPSNNMLVSRLGKIMIVIDKIVINYTSFVVIVIENFQKSIIVIEKFSVYFQLLLLCYSPR